MTFDMEKMIEKYHRVRALIDIINTRVEEGHLLVRTTDRRSIKLDDSKYITNPFYDEGYSCGCLIGVMGLLSIRDGRDVTSLLNMGFDKDEINCLESGFEGWEEFIDPAGHSITMDVSNDMYLIGKYVYEKYASDQVT